MLKSLLISNYALISKLDFRPGKGLTVLTGETGAGKSIILGALSLILGQRADSKAIQANSDKCVVEAEFDISGYKHLSDFFTENELDNDGVNCLIRREINVSGKSRAFINDTPVGLTQLRELSNQLLDIHSQHENLLLSNVSYQLEVLDTVAGNAGLLQDYRKEYQQWRQATTALEQLRNDAEKASAEYDFLQFQYQQLFDAQLQLGEQEELELEADKLQHAGEISSSLHQIVDLLDGESAVLSRIKEAQSVLSKTAAYLPEGQQQLERMESSFIELKELKIEMDALKPHYELDPQRLEWVQNRLSDLYGLQHKFKVATIDDLIDIRNRFALQLQTIESFDERIARTEDLLSECQQRLSAKAVALTEARKCGTDSLEQTMIEQLTELGMPSIQFKTSVTTSSDFTPHGCDAVQFLFSANKNREMQPVQQIASGGEISRLMLSIKAMIAEKTDLPTIILDEIDTGISGEIAHRMGAIMQRMSRSMQVIAITHLPQIAAKGEAHFKVYKDDSGLQTETFIRELNHENRLHEIASMISGDVTSDAALQHARELFKK
jgi:DNA repair protein RecN (Recombination protein N)